MIEPNRTNSDNILSYSENKKPIICKQSYNHSKVKECMKEYIKKFVITSFVRLSKTMIEILSKCDWSVHIILMLTKLYTLKETTSNNIVLYWPGVVWVNASNTIKHPRSSCKLDTLSLIFR